MKVEPPASPVPTFLSTSFPRHPRLFLGLAGGVLDCDRDNRALDFEHVAYTRIPAGCNALRAAGRRATVAAEPLPASVGRITGMVDCKWNGGSHVSLGQKCQLASGLMEITYDTGAKVILQGPVTYEAESNGGYLSVGKLTGKLEKKAGMVSIANPFVIRTPTAIVTDLGTEFGIEVTKDQQDRLHVFQGKVVVRTDAAVSGVPHEIEMNAGESASVDMHGAMMRYSGPRATTIVNPAGFVRTIRERTLSPSFSDDFMGGPSRRWDRWITRWAADFTNNNAKFTDATAPDRNYLRTVYSHYGTADFVATVKLTNADGDWGSAFFGIGEGTRKDSGFGEPSNGECIYMLYHGQGLTDRIGNVRVNSPFTSTPFSLPNRAAGTTIGVQLTWVAATGTATFKLDTNNDGVYDDDTITVTNPKLALAENPTRLFVGGTHGVIVNDFTVSALTPEKPLGDKAVADTPEAKKRTTPVGQKGGKPME